MSNTIESALPLVFLHAYPLSAAMWETQARLFPDRAVLAPNLPGFGGRAADALTLDDFAASVIADMDAAGIERAIIVGLSMGGYVAFRLHARWADRVGGLVLADTRAAADSEEAAAKRTEQARRVRDEGVDWLPEAILPGLLGDTSRRERPQLVDGVRSMILDSDPEGVGRALIAMRDRPDSRPGLAEIAVPVLALVGEEDSLTPVADARLIAEGVAHGSLVVIPGAGHLSNLENPERFGEAILSFVG